MQWLELTIKTTSSGIDLVAAQLTALGFDSFMIDDQQDFQEFLAENTAYWDYVDDALAQKMSGLSQITLYLEDNAAAAEQISVLREQLAALQARCPRVDFGELSVSLSNLPDEDWENSWRKNYQPLPIGQRLLVVPYWLTPDNPEQRIPVLLDPGMIFGTGAHASTQMCMVALEHLIHGGERVIDLGSGSGILSITALLLGAATATGVDIDPKAEDIARENAAINHLGGDRFTAGTCNVLTDAGAMQRLAQGGYDVVCANIVADVIIPLAAIVPQFLRKGGSFICSGILATRAEEVKAALYAAGLTITGSDQMDGWCMFRLQKSEG